MSDDRPLASPEAERLLREDFPFQTISPEEFAARNAADILCLSLDRFRYVDPQFDVWIRRLADILNDWKLVMKYRAQYLTAEEIERAVERDQGEF